MKILQKIFGIVILAFFIVIPVNVFAESGLGIYGTEGSGLNVYGTGGSG